MATDTQAANRRLARNSLFMTVRMVIVILVSLYTTRVVLNALGVADYGVYNVVAGFVVMFAFLNNSLSTAVQRFYNVELANNGTAGAREVYCASFKIHLYLGLIVLVVTEAAGWWYIPNKMVLPPGQLEAALWLFQFSVVSLFFNILYTPYMAAVISHEKMDFYAVAEIFNNVLKLGMAFSLPFLPGSKLIWYGLYNLFIAILVFVMYLAYCKKKFPEIELGAAVPRKMFKEILSFSGWGVTGAFAYTLREQGVNLVLNFFFGTVVNAARGITNQINGALSGFTANLFVSSRPQVIQSYSTGDYDRAWKLTFSLSKVMFLLFFIMALPVCVNINYILKLWLGDNIPDYTAIFTIMLMATSLVSSFLSPISTIMHATGRLKFYSILSSGSNLLTVPLAYLFLLVYKIPEVVYVALFITMVTNLLAGLISARKYANLNCLGYVKSVIGPCLLILILAVPLGVLPTFFLTENFIIFILETIYCIIISSLLVYFIALSNQEKLMVKGLINKIIKRR